jgi:uncharacterized phiE125 gp8 family phage protein
MALTLITAATLLPVSIAECKRQLILGTTAGEPVPIAPAVALSAVAGNVTAGAHRYLVTFVTADGETAAGDASAAVTTILATHGQVSISAIPLGGAAVTSRKIYRTAAGGSTYLLLTTLANNTATTYTDNIADGSLGAQAPTTNTTVDPELTDWIKGATERAELHTQRSLLTQTWDLVMDRFPEETYIEIPKPPLVSVTYLKYKDTQGTLQTWAATNYIVDAPAGPRCRRGRLSLAFGVVWPSTYGQAGDVTLRFVCGNTSAANVPALIRQAILLDVATNYTQRENVITGTIVQTLPWGSEAVYRSYRSRARQKAGL